MEVLHDVVVVLVYVECCVWNRNGVDFIVKFVKVQGLVNVWVEGMEVVECLVSVFLVIWC